MTHHVATLALSLALAPLLAAATTDGPKSPRDCSQIADREQRLACFDSFYPKGSQTPLPVLASHAVAAQGATDGTAPEHLFGLNDEVRRARGERLESDAAPEQIQSALAGLEPLGPGRLRLTLANGQVWDQVEAVPSFQPRAGDPITVRQASLGSYLLRGRVGAPVRARRVR
jgi:hypothetical protein